MIQGCAVCSTRCALAGLGHPARPSQASRSCYHSDTLTAGQRSLSLKRGVPERALAAPEVTVCLTEEGNLDCRRPELPQEAGFAILQSCSGQLMSPKWYCKILAELVLAAPCPWAIQNVIFNPMHSLGCLHHTSPWRWHSQRAFGMNTALRLLHFSLAS